MLCTRGFVLLRPKQAIPFLQGGLPRLYIIGTSTTLSHAPKILDLKKYIYFVNDRLGCVTIPSLDYFIYFKVF